MPVGSCSSSSVYSRLFNLCPKATPHVFSLPQSSPGLFGTVTLSPHSPSRLCGTNLPIPPALLVFLNTVNSILVMVWTCPLLPATFCLWPLLFRLLPLAWWSYCLGSKGTALVSLSRLHVAWGWALCTCPLSHRFPGSCWLGELPYDHIGAKGPWSRSRSALSSRHHGQHSSRHFLGTRHTLIKWMNWQEKKKMESDCPRSHMLGNMSTRW